MTIGSHDWEGLTLPGGRYRITAKLGEGGMGFVYRALDQNIDAEVVIKVPRQAMMDDPEFAGRFTREIRSLVKLSHPHIVKVTDVGTVDGIPFAVMQFLAGGSLEDQRPAGPDGRVLPCDPRKVSRWLVAVADALDYIHTQGYVHRDVKPGNILFDTQGHAFLSDFGVAKVLASSTNAPPSQTAMTGAGMVLGTPEYMAPELIMGEPFDGRVDQYALAITVYELLCGRRPFEDETKTKVLVLHTSRKPPSLTEWSAALPDRLSQVVLRGLAKDPSERYSRCAELARAITAAAEGAVAQDTRVRLKCSACGKTAAMPAADFARLKESGKSAPCPACKSPIDVSTALKVAPGASPGGTMKFSVSGNPGEYALTSSSGPAPPGMPQPQPGGTMALSAQTKPPPLPGSGTLIERALPRSGSGTLIERALPRCAEAAAPNVFKGSPGSELNRPDSLNPEMLVRSQKPAGDMTRIWIVAAAGTGTVLLAAIGFAVILSGSGKKSDSSSSSLTANSPQPPAAPKTEPNTSASGPTSPSAPPPAPAEVSSPPRQAEQAERTKSGGGRIASADNPVPTKKQQSFGRRKNANAAASRPQPPPPTGVFAKGSFDITRLPQKARPVDYSVEKIIAKPQSYRDAIVVPAGMYCLTCAAGDRQSGPRKYLVTERSLTEQGPRKTLQMNSLWSAEMEFEPGLAAEIARHWRSLEGRVAILTVWISSSGEPGIVRAEILQKFTPKLKPGFGIGQADIDYEVLFVGPDGSKPARADDADWQKVGRMNHLYLHHKHMIAAFKRKLQVADMAGLSVQMNRMYAGMLKGMAAEAAQERALERSKNGR